MPEHRHTKTYQVIRMAPKGAIIRSAMKEGRDRDTVGDRRRYAIDASLPDSRLRQYGGTRDCNDPIWPVRVAQ